MGLLCFLFALPLLVVLVLVRAKTDAARDRLTVAGAVLTAAALLAFAVMYMNAPQQLFVPAAASLAGNYLAALIDLALCVLVLRYAVAYRHPVMLGLAVAQLVAAAWCALLAFTSAHAQEAPLYVDDLSVVMVLVVGVVGGAICVYALGYMKDFQAHQPSAAPDRRSRFLALMFLFLSAMFVIVTSDNLDWLLAGWEVTTVCSFLMIGYTRTPEARRSAILQINLNMVGGMAFYLAVIFMHGAQVPLSLTGLLAAATGPQAPILALPLALLSIAGLTKTAQMPFHRWLLGAMVAPTPTSALLHSSTMVKAGVFLLVKLAPLYLLYPVVSQVVTAVGGITFVLCSLMAISQSNAKRVLAYSTIANLGLISACAGIGTPEAVWAAILLIIFHTLAKCLLFLCVGSVEHRIGSRDIEDMDGLYARLPRLARVMMLGIMGMFLAPFGMLVSKWAALVSIAETGNVFFIILLVFGSAATFFFWAKWLGKLAGVPQRAENEEGGVHTSEWTAIGVVAVLLVACCAGFPAISQLVVSPYLESVYGVRPELIAVDDLVIMAVMVVFSVAVLFAPRGHAGGERATCQSSLAEGGRAGKGRRRVDVYLGGEPVDADARTYRGAMGRIMTATKRNWYLSGIFGERWLTRAGIVVCACAMLAGLAMSAGVALSAGPAVAGAGAAAEWVGGAGAVPGMLLSAGLPAETLVQPARDAFLLGPDLPRVILGIVVFAVIAPVAGCLLDGLDRKLSARLQGRMGPRLLQPYYDLRKLCGKELAGVNGVDDAYITCALVCCAVAGGVFISGSNLLMCIFLMTLATVFVVLAAYSARSPFADTGADRECLQVMSYEPMLLIMAVGFFAATGSFDVAVLARIEAPIVFTLAPIFLGVLFILTIKLRKSPFDLSYSHHAHQELVKGITTEMSGRTLAKTEVLHWCEVVLFLMWVGMFFIWGTPASGAVALVAVAAVWLLEVFIDNNFARVKWQACLAAAWAVSLVAGALNLVCVFAPLVF